ncbi:MAG: hypothetical protein P1P88_02940 [Bacteroidales bacterium]|nr:hypothetical protein [Bacteroidales bacterium]
MLALKKTILGISDLKSLFQSIKSFYSDDYSNYAISSLKRRIEEFMFSFHMLNIDELINKLEKDKTLYQLFIDAIQVETTEMFRDPEFWVQFRDLVLKKYRYAKEIKVWIPDCNSGEELYSLQIILHQLKMNEKTSVYVSTITDKNVETIKKATIDHKKMELNIANFDRYEEGAKLTDYFILKSNAALLNAELLDNVKVEKRNLFTDEHQGVYDCILYRNKMLYYNPQLKNEALKRLNTSLKPGGYIAVGIKESVDFPSWEREFIVISESERIYKKVLA